MKSYHIEQINSNINNKYTNDKTISTCTYIIQYSAFSLIYYLIEIFLLENNSVLVGYFLDYVHDQVPALTVSKQKYFLKQILCIQSFIQLLARGVTKRSDESSSHDFAEFNLVANFTGNTRRDDKNNARKIKHVIPTQKRA